MVIKFVTGALDNARTIMTLAMDAVPRKDEPISIEGRNFVVAAVSWEIIRAEPRVTILLRPLPSAAETNELLDLEERAN